MTSKSSSNGSGLPKAPSDKAAFIQFIERKLNLQPDCSVVDLDLPAHIQTLPQADIGIWLDSWHHLVDALGPSDNAHIGVETARDILYLASCRISNLLFSADIKPPLDQFGPPGRGLQMLFQASTCYTSVIPIALYKGRVVYWGNQPSFKWTDEECKSNDVRSIRLSQYLF
jgi:hypothetical protein